MIKRLPPSIRARLRQIDWLASAYRRYIAKLPDAALTGFENNYQAVQRQNDQALSLLPRVKNGVSFSLITPVYRPNLDHFDAMVASVLAQSYPYWQLILINDDSKEPELSQKLNELAKHPKINVIERNQNGHISQASNDGLRLAKGDYIALLDHDDLLHPEALNAMALSICADSKLDILYSDEDKVNEQGQFEQPHFKPKWSPDLLFSHNYICHFLVIRRALVEHIGGFRLGVEGSQDYDLVLRATKASSAERIAHLPYVLYHWRIAEGSTALDGAAKSYAEISGLKALNDYMAASAHEKDVKNKVTVSLGLLTNTYKINWPVPSPAPLVSIIIPTKNRQDLVRQCLDSIFQRTDYSNFEILLVDNQSEDAKALAYFDLLEKEGKVRLLAYQKPFNYSAINNYAVTQAKGEVIVLMNNDTEILNSAWLGEMVSHCCRDEIGCVGAKLYYPDQRIQHAGVILGIGGVAGHSHKYFPRQHPGYFKRLQIVQNLSAVTGACLAVRKKVFEQVSGLNEQDLAIAFNDVDFCLKVLQAGYRNIWTPYAEMMHHESVSRGHEDTPEKVIRFNKEVDYMKKTYGKHLLSDPYYSPWLTLEKEDFSLRI